MKAAIVPSVDSTRGDDAQEGRSRRGYPGYNTLVDAPNGVLVLDLLARPNTENEKDDEGEDD